MDRVHYTDTNLYTYQMNVSDDILIGGTTETHNAALPRGLDTLDRNNISVNPTKCFFDV